MKIKGEFVVREIMGDTILIPVGKTALDFNGMITMNPVSGLIWKELAAGKEKAQILDTVLDVFDVEEAVARADMEEFLQTLHQAGFLDL